MKIAIICFSEQGKRLAEKVSGSLPDHIVTINTNYREKGKEEKEGLSVRAWTEKCFREKSALLFIGAAGIAVRSVSPFLKDKFEDPPVLCMDEAGNYIIPLLSGHIGGANFLAEKIGAAVGVTPVITTATDVRKKFAVDVWAKNSGFYLPKESREKMKYISGKVLREETILISVEGRENGTGRLPETLPDGLEAVPYPPEQYADVVISSEETFSNRAGLYLKPRQYVIGIGTKKGKTREEIQCFLEPFMEKLGIGRSDIYCFSSIDRKKDEEGIISLAGEFGVPFLTFTETALREVKGEFQSSEFVREITGVDNVCERAAVLGCGEKGTLVLKKQIGEGMTIAVAKRDWSVRFDET